MSAFNRPLVSGSGDTSEECLAMGIGPEEFFVASLLEHSFQNLCMEKNYTSLRAIHRRNGVGLNADDDYEIDILDDQWGQLVAVIHDMSIAMHVSCATGGVLETVDVTVAKVRAQMESGCQVHGKDFIPNVIWTWFQMSKLLTFRIVYEFDLGKARQEVFEKLACVDGLSLDQRHELCDILGKKPQRLEVFMGMLANAKLRYVLRLIE
ncbi:hypothetical protein SASPL_154119 [Salvia splendens]|uniref:Uncharacterized protein n=1 Tax=Salvia splendens TaxID=180675 RepID=A0A8X8YY63_SALSN|nr:hypothetical protein SASPL_154119 [Salvia splendens]